MRVLARVVNVLGQQHHYQLPVAAQHQVFVFDLHGDLHAGQAVFEAAHDLFDERSRIHALHVNGNFAGIQPRRGEQARGQVAQQTGLLVDQRYQLGLPRRKMAHLAQACRCRANRCQRSLVGVRQAVEHRGAQLFGAPLGLDPALVGKGAIAVEGDGNQRCNGIVDQRAGVAAHHQAADGHRSQAHHAPSNPARRIVIRGFEIVDVLRHLLGIDVPVACLVHVVQIGVEDRDGFEVEDIVHQLGQLRSGLDVQVHLQGAPRELVEILHLPAPRLRLARVLGDARGKPAHGESHQHKHHQRDRAGRVGGQGQLRMPR